MPVISQRLRRVPQLPTTGVRVLRESLEQLHSDLPVSFLEEHSGECIAPFEFGKSPISDLECDLFHEVGRQRARDIVTDPVRKPDQVVQVDVVLGMECAETIDDQVLQGIRLIYAGQDVGLEKVAAAGPVGRSFWRFIV